MTTSHQWFQRAKKVLPGGVNSPVRAFGSVGREPLFIDKAEGPWLWDVEGNRYLDFVGSWGPMIFGHVYEPVLAAVGEAAKKGLSYGAPTAAEVEMAELMCNLVPSLQMVRMVSSGTEAVMSALRVARGYTGREFIVKFQGCYHGHADGMLVQAGSGAATFGVPDSAGVPAAIAQQTLTVPYNDLKAVQELFVKRGQEIAAVIVEPVAANMGVVLPQAGFLQGLREITTEYGALLILDEVITGFRLGLDGAQGYFGVQPDLSTFGKIIGGGLPVGAFGGRREVMSEVAPLGKVYQAGTLSGNPVAMAAGLCSLRSLQEQPSIYQQMESRGKRLAQGLRAIFKEAEIPVTVNQVGSLCCLYFTEGPVNNYADAKRSDTERYKRYFNAMLEQGIYLSPSQFEALFLSAAHSADQIEWVLKAVQEIVEGGLLA